MLEISESGIILTTFQQYQQQQHIHDRKKKIYTKFFESRISRNQIIIQAAYRTFGKSKKDQKKKKTVKVPVKVPEAQSLTWRTQSRITQQTKSFLYIYIRIFARISGGSGVEDGSVDGSEKFKSQVSS